MEVQVMAEGAHVRLVRRGRWEYLERTRASLAVVIAALTPGNKLLIVEQYRPPVAGRVLELPAGLVGDEPGEASSDVMEAARRELLEETGYHPAKVTILTQGPPSPGLSNETIALVRAEGLEKRGEGGGVGEEDIILHEVPLVEAASWLENRRREGFIIDPKIYAGLFFLAKDSQAPPA